MEQLAPRDDPYREKRQYKTTDEAADFLIGLHQACGLLLLRNRQGPNLGDLPSEAPRLIDVAGLTSAIVIDTDIPRHSGYGVLTYLKEEVGEDTLRNVIAMTSSDRDEVRRKVSDKLNVVSKDDAVAEFNRVMTQE